MLSDLAVDAADESALSAYPEECCGFLLGRVSDTYREVNEVREAGNIRENRRERRYRIEPLELMRLEEEIEGSAQDLLGFYHSHPNHPPNPSEYDREHAWPWYTYVILSINENAEGELTAWKLKDDREAFDELHVVEKNSGGESK